jgi:hypothetical protein
VYCARGIKYAWKNLKGAHDETWLKSIALGFLDHLGALRKTALKPGDRTVWLSLHKVIGPIWYLVMARGDYNDLDELVCATVYSKHQLSDVTTYHGGFQGFSALRELVDWTETSYRPWFESWVFASHHTNVALF